MRRKPDPKAGDGIDRRVQDLTVDSYGSNERDQTRSREQAGAHLDEAGEPTLADAEELRRANPHED